MPSEATDGALANDVAAPTDADDLPMHVGVVADAEPVASALQDEPSDEAAETVPSRARMTTRGGARKSRKQRKRERLREKVARADLAKITLADDATPPHGSPASNAVAPIDVASAPAMDGFAEAPPSDARNEDAADSPAATDKDAARTATGRATDPQSPDFVVDFDVSPTAVSSEPAAVARKSGVFLAVASFVAVVGILVGMAWLRYQQDHTPANNAARPSAAQTPPSPPSTAPDAVVAAPLEPMVGAPPPIESTPAPTVPPPVAPDVQVRITELLSRADAHLQALQLTTPAGENAFEDYNEVLRLQPDNEAARQGITAISARYVELADGAIVRGEYVAARRYLELAQMVDPANETVQGRREELRNRRQSGRVSQDQGVVADASVADGSTAGETGVVGRVREFLKPDPGAAGQASRADEIRERLGGQ